MWFNNVTKVFDKRRKAIFASIFEGLIGYFSIVNSKTYFVFVSVGDCGTVSRDLGMVAMTMSSFYLAEVPNAI
jgi:hypothetical protein